MYPSLGFGILRKKLGHPLQQRVSRERLRFSLLQRESKTNPLKPDCQRTALCRLSGRHFMEQ